MLLGERLLSADQVRAAVATGQLERPLIEGDAGGAVSERRFLREGADDFIDPGLAAGGAQAADALPPEREAHGAVDTLEDPRQNFLPLDEHDAADARRPARYPLRDTDDFHSALPIPHPDAVVPGTELVPHLPHSQAPHPEAREGPERQSGG